MRVTDTQPALSPAVALSVNEAREALEQVESLAFCLTQNLTDAVRRDYQGRLERAIRRAVQKADAFIVSV